MLVGFVNCGHTFRKMKRSSIILHFLFLVTISQVHAQKLNLLIGTYTAPGKSEGIYVYEFDASSGKLVYKNKVAGLNNPSYLTISKDEKNVYAVNEAGQGKSSVSSFSFNKQSGALTLLNQQPSGGDGPCYVAVDKKSNHVFVANYAGGSFSVLPVLNNGSLGEPSQLVVFTSNGVGKGQQDKPHAHSTVLSPEEKYVYVSDLGNDEIMAYRYSAKSVRPLSPSKYGKTSLPAGSGPRHFDFHPNGKFAYSLQELTCDVVAYRYKRGKLSRLQTISGLPQNYTGRKWAADIHVSPDGKFLYSSNRDDANDIAIFAIQKNGTLTSVGRHPSLGKAPRNFVIDPTGNFLLVANQNSHVIVVLKRNKETGLLSDTGEKIEISSPVCLKFSATN